MAPGGNDWLAQTPEEPLEPEIPICDPHHHFWVSRPEPAHYQQYLLPERQQRAQCALDGVH